MKLAANLALNVDYKVDVVFFCVRVVNQTLSNHSDQAQKTQTVFWANQNLKQIHVAVTMLAKGCYRLILPHLCLMT